MTNNFEALPIEVAQSALTTNQKKLLEVFVLFDGLEKTKDNGCFFASNADLMLKSGIGSHHTLTKVIRSFELNKFITRNVGSFEGRQATTYALDMEAVLNWCESHPIGAVSKRRKSASIKSASIMGAVSQKCLDEESAKVAQLEKKIIELEAVNKALVKALSKCGIEAVEKAVIGAHIGAHIGAVIGAVMEKCPTDTDTEKETTNHIVTSSNSSMGLPICVREGKATFKKVEGNDTDEVTPSNEVDQTGDVCDFQNKIEGEVTQSQPEEKNNEQGEINPNGMTTPDDEQIINPNGEVTQSQPDEEINKSQATANKASGSVATPQMVQDTTDTSKRDQNANKGANPASGNVTLNAEDEQQTINYLNELEMTLRDSNTNLNRDEVIATSNELKATLDKWSGKSSHIVELATIRIVNLVNWFATDITTLTDVRDIFTSHLRESNGNVSDIANSITQAYQTINSQPRETALIWTMTPQVAQLSIQSGKTREIANKVANPASGNTDTNPQNENTPQTSENKAAGSVSAPQMGKLSTDTSKRDQSAPDKATEAMTKDNTTDTILTSIANLNAQYVAGDYEKENKATELANKLAERCGKIDTIEKVNWCATYIPKILKEHGRVLGTNAAIYVTVTNSILERRRQELSAA